MRWPLVGITVSFLGVACSAPEESEFFEETASIGSGGASSVDTTSSSSTGSSEGGAGAEASDAAGGSGTGGGAGSDTTTTRAGGSTSTSVGGAGGSGGSTLGTTTGDTGGTAGTGGTTGTGGAATTSSSTSSGGVSGTGGGECTRSEEVCDGLDNDCDDDVDDDVCPSGCVGASLDAHTYLFCDRPGMVGNSEPKRSWEQAMQFCANRGYLLTLVETQAENAFIYQMLVQLEVSGDVWMGATDQEDESWWRWAASEDPDEWVAFYDEEAHEPIASAFNDWREGEPNDDGGEDCGIFEDLSSDEWAWDDRSCQLEYDLFVCESTD